jgi:hypothetical protein
MPERHAQNSCVCKGFTRVVIPGVDISPRPRCHAALASVGRLLGFEGDRRAQRDADGVDHGLVGLDVGRKFHHWWCDVRDGLHRLAKRPRFAPVDHDHIGGEPVEGSQGRLRLRKRGDREFQSLEAGFTEGPPVRVGLDHDDQWSATRTIGRTPAAAGVLAAVTSLRALIDGGLAQIWNRRTCCGAS